MSSWDGIDEFVAIATAGTFRGGASALAVSTTHMSRAIVRLEARLQTQLFHRTTRSVRLTDTGRVFLEHCQRMLMEREEAFALVNETGEPQGELRLTCSTAMGERFIAPILRRFARTYPRLQVNIDLTNRVVDLVAEGYDLAVRTGHLPDSRLIGTRIASRSLVTCASPDYLARRGSPRTVDDLGSQDLLVGNAGTWHFRVDGKARSYRPHSRWRCNSGSAVLEAALDGMGVCQLPGFYVRQTLAEGTLVPLLTDLQPADEPIWAVYPQRRHLQPKISELVSVLRKELPAMLGMGGKV
ncbi:LysR substrate-binding domain-containing protein [Novosphingobium album (ex Hu et al. 2023)]|uniref:LysR substrate-binding domain-containing protein n=1 Tax=Novosphingobium album (ex Hu et al. 2023) TaxID=2930093 RepID=A0ABT0B2J5_9SPHN|nr:LysR substrate-binding domain-containing protein [Novosphingobium album (ex Hu et al. 2023)]MCJ2179173.1 LysR substrate-binding domain-containing protein [Novosphingobium album (ex Hu et al. 2023)]